MSAEILHPAVEENGGEVRHRRPTLYEEIRKITALEREVATLRERREHLNRARAALASLEFSRSRESAGTRST